MARPARVCDSGDVHPVVAVLIAMTVASLILGALTALMSLRDVPEAYEDDNGFWRLAEDETAEPLRVRVVAKARIREET
jgi:hypothetical protein